MKNLSKEHNMELILFDYILYIEYVSSSLYREIYLLILKTQLISS